MLNRVENMQNTYGCISSLSRIHASLNRFSIGSNTSLSPILCQAIIWTNVVLLSMGTSRITFSKFILKNTKPSIHEMCLKMTSAKWQTFCTEEDELNSVFIALHWERNMSYLMPSWLDVSTNVPHFVRHIVNFSFGTHTIAFGISMWCFLLGCNGFSGSDGPSFIEHTFPCIVPHDSNQQSITSTYIFHIYFVHITFHAKARQQNN